jgi:hypothetical protein
MTDRKMLAFGRLLSKLTGIQSHDNAKSLGAPFSVKFRDDINRAANAIKPDPFYSSKLCKTAQQIQELYGPEFLSLVPPGKPPCMKFFLFGDCTYQTCFNQPAYPHRRTVKADH